MSRYTIIGAGGLGGPVAYALAATGASMLTFIDDDMVALSNLQRQIQFRTADIGRPKVDALADELSRRGCARTRLRPIRHRFDAANALELLGAPHHLPDVVIDASDNFATKFIVNDACVSLGVPAVIGGVLRYEGQVLAIAPGQSGCYRCVFEAPPPEDALQEAQSCAQAGVLGATVAVIAGHQARAALALARGQFEMAGRLLILDDITASLTPRVVAFEPRSDCTACATSVWPHVAAHHSERPGDRSDRSGADRRNDQVEVSS